MSTLSANARCLMIPKSVFLVGGFAASDWLFSRLQEHIRPMNLNFCRPDSQTYVPFENESGSLVLTLNLSEIKRLQRVRSYFISITGLPHVYPSLHTVPDVPSSSTRMMSNINFGLRLRFHVHRDAWSSRTPSARYCKR